MRSLFFFSGIFFLSVILCSHMAIGQIQESIEENIGKEVISDPEIIEEDTVITDSLLLPLPEYSDWEVALLNGKMKIKGLPVSPSLRIYMQKDSLIDISIKVPFLGEIGRIMLTPDSVVGINKMNRTYTSAYLLDFLRFYPGGVGEIQDLLLGRIVMPGIGILNENTADKIDVYETDEGFAVVPSQSFEIEGFDYGYIVDEDFIPKVLLVIPEYHNENNLIVNYMFSTQGYELTIDYQHADRLFEIIFEIKSIDWDGKKMKPINLEKNYKLVGIGDFIRNFGK